MNRDGRNLKRIKSATLCTFTVHWDAHNDTRRLPHRYPMSILLKCTGMNASSAKENLMIAVNMLVDIILKFPASDKWPSSPLRMVDHKVAHSCTW